MRTHVAGLVFTGMMLCSSGSAQSLQEFVWEPIDGPYGALVRSVVVTELGTVLAATGNGIFRSTNEGLDWSQTAFGGEGVTSLVMDFSHAVIARTSSGFYRSTDDGLVWDMLPWPSFSTVHCAWGEIFLAADVSKGVYGSTDQGNTWSPMGLSGVRCSRVLCTSQGTLLAAGWALYCKTLEDQDWREISGPRDAKSLFEHSSGKLFAGGFDGLYSSTDNGVTWDEVGLKDGVHLSGFCEADSNYLFAGALPLDPSIAGGVYRSADTGKTWIRVGLEEWPITSLAITPSATLLAGAGGRGVFGTTDRGETWASLHTGLTNVRMAALCIVGGTTVVAGTNMGVFLTSDGGDSWQDCSSGIRPAEIVSMTADQSGYIYVGNMLFDPYGGVYRSEDGGSTWVNMTHDYIRDMSAEAITALMVSRQGDIYAGVGHMVFRSTDHGATWSSSEPLTSSGVFHSMACDSADRLFAGFWGAGVFQSLDDGWTWTPINAGITDQNIRCIAAKDTSWVFAGGIGLFRSSDHGASWMAVNSMRWINTMAILPDGSVLVSSDGGLFRSTDNGDTWTLTTSGLNITALQVDARGVAWAQTGDAIYRSSVSLLLTRLRVPQDYPTIQSAIDAAHQGDTVLVSEGTYYENIRYRGKAITVGSLYVIDGDTNHIGKTIIDGSRPTEPDSGSVVSFVNGEDTTSVLCGFTITGGSGTRCHLFYGWATLGGGVFCDSAGARLTRNIIARNRVLERFAHGAGVAASTVSASFVPVVILEGNLITDNYAESYHHDSIACSGGGASLAGVESRVFGNVFERDTVVGGFGAQGGGLLVFGWRASGPYSYPNGSVVANTFRSNVVHGSGAGGTGGGLGVKYTGQVTIRDNLIQSNTATSLATSGYSLGGGLYVYDEEIGVDRQKVILNNRFLGNTVFCDYNNRGGGLALVQTLATVSGNEFAANAVLRHGYFGGGAGISMDNSSFHVENNIVTRNSSAIGAGAVFVDGVPGNVSEHLIANNTIVNNRGYSVGGLDATGASNLVVLNNIFWDDTATFGTGHPEIAVDGSIRAIAYCNVKGGYAGSGNVDQDPVFLTGDSLFHLMPNSPCIEGGIDSLQMGGIWYHAPTSDYDGMVRPMPAGTRPDIGAQEERISVPAYAHDGAIDRSYASPGTDSVCLTARLSNSLNHTAALSAIITDAGGAVRDSVRLFDDGVHGDKNPGDSLWGCFIHSPLSEDFYRVAIRTDDITQGSFRRLPNVATFTTAGPVAVDSIATRRTMGSYVRVDLWLRNLGRDCVIPSIKAVLRTTDPVVDSFIVNDRAFGNLSPGQRNGGGVVFYFTADTSVHTADVPLTLEVSSNGQFYWTSETTARLTTGVIASDLSLPREYRLEQNYPNPFNPSTTICYGLPQSSHVTLTVFNTLGQQVSTLVEGEMEAGYHEAVFDASGLASGVYLYRLHAGDFVQIHKLVLIR